jgi:hypothetical protein
MAERGRPLGAQNKDKPFRDALRMEIAACGEDLKALREVAKALLVKAQSGDVAATKELADRLDGKVPQAVVGDSEHDAIRLESNMSDLELARRLAFILESARRNGD